MNLRNSVYLLSMAVLTACSDVRLAPLPPERVTASSEGSFCTLSPEAIKRHTKFLFVMDKSGSNSSGNGMGGGGTDPGATKRAGSFERFYNENKDKDFIRWGMIAFQDPGTKALIGEPQDPIFVGGDPESDGIVQEAITKLKASDGGGTPYGAALALTEKAIATDIRNFPDEDNMYMVFFLSDGVPTDGASDVNTLMGLVRNIVNLSPGKVFVSTGYYDAGGTNPVAIDRLQRMAEAGLGKFVNFRDTDEFNFDELIVGGPTKEPWQVKNLVVYNLNGSLCENGSMGVDSDGDGVCDVDEQKYGLNPQKRFTYNESSFGDFFHWRKIKFGEVLPACDDRSDEDHDLLTRCEEMFIFNATPVSPSPDITIPQRGDKVNPDTDLDTFLDGIEVFSFRDKSSPMNARDVLTDFDGEGNAGNQIKQHRNPMLWDPGTPAYDTRITPREIRSDTGQTCYNFSQTNLTIYPTLSAPAAGNFPGHKHAAGENLVLIYYIQTPQREPLGRGILMYSLQRLKVKSQAQSDSLGTAAGLKVEDGVFSAYIVPRTSE